MAADLHRTCTECGEVLRPRRRKDGSEIPLRADKLTCDDDCRSRRKRRLDRQRRQIVDGDGDGATALAAIAPSTNPSRVQDILKDVFKDELRPLVRESITEDTLRAIKGMVALTPLMVEKIGLDLEHPDPVIRQKAYSVMARYTLGHAALVSPEQANTNQQLTVVFDGMVRPGTPPAIDVDGVPVEDTTAEGEVRECNGCLVQKAASEFVGNSDRCSSCHAALKQRAEAILD